MPSVRSQSLVEASARWIRSADCEKSYVVVASGQSGGTVTTSTTPEKRSMSFTSWRMIRRFRACKAIARAPRGGTDNEQEVPVGRTITRVAPIFTAVEIGVLFATPPSTRQQPSSITGGKTPGIAALARSAVVAAPEDNATSVPFNASVATT